MLKVEPAPEAYHPLAPVTQPDVQRRVAEVVNAVHARTARDLPSHERAAKRDAMLAELRGLAAAYEELGDSAPAALQHAVEEFERRYAVAHVSTHAAATHTRTERRNASVAPAMLTALALFGSCYVLYASKLAERLYDRLYPASPYLTLWRFEAIVAPLLLGLIVGLAVRRRAMRGVLYAIGLLAIWAVFAPALQASLSILQLWPERWGDMAWTGWDFPAACVGLSLWPLLGCAGAALGASARRGCGRLRRRLRSRRPG